MTHLIAACLNCKGEPKKAYPSEHAAKRDLANSHKWRRRATWPVVYRCQCGAYHLAHGDAL